MKTVTKALEELNNAEGYIKEMMNLIPGLNYTIGKFGFVTVNTDYYDSHHKESLNDPFNCVSVAEKIAYEVNDYDCPTKISDAKKFCEFMEFNEKDTEAILKVCSSDEAYDNWARQERMSYLD